MAKKIARHLARKKYAYLLTVLAAAIGIGFYFSFFWGSGASAITGVTIVDADTTGYGLDGRDFMISWTPGEAPAGYVYTQIYITSSSIINLTTSTISSTTACGGTTCIPVGYFNQYTMSSMSLPQYMPTDSSGVAWTTTTQYVAWVFVSTTLPGFSIIASSSPVSTTFDVVANVSPPMIDHMSVNSAQESANAIINAIVMDDQTTDAQFATLNDGGSEYFKLFYSTGAGAWSGTASATVVSVTGNLFQFTVPSAAVPAAGGMFKYYLVANDSGNNLKFFCANPAASDAAGCQADPFSVSTVAAGSRTISGTVTSGGAALASAKVFAGGFAKAAVTTDGSGNYSIIGLPDSNSYDVTAAKAGYCKNMRNEFVGTTNKIGIDLSLNLGACGFYGGGGGGSVDATPRVMFSGPPDGMQSAPVTEKIRVGINQSLDSTTVNDSNAADTGSNVYLTTDDGTTKIAGTATYCASSASPGCSSLFSQDTNTILFSPSANLATSTFYTLVITEGVKSAGGQSITGNRPGGGHRISFTTVGNTFSGGDYTMGGGGQYMPPYVRSMSPGGGMSIASNVGLTLEFNAAMSELTITTGNITLHDMTTGGNAVSISSVTLDSNEKRFVNITPASLVSGHNYELRVKGAVASANGITMRPQGQTTEAAFNSSFSVSSGTDTLAPTVYPMLANNSTGVATNNIFEFGFNESLAFLTVNSTNVTLTRGSTSVGISAKFDPSKNSVYVIPDNVLSPNTVYTLTLGGSVKDLANNSLATTTYSYTTGAGDTTAPVLKEARCDDYTCVVYFNEPMNHATRLDSTWASSTINHFNISLTQGGADKAVTTTMISYDADSKSIKLESVGLTSGGTNYTISIANVVDISGNLMANSQVVGPVESSAQTFGSFGDMGMFGPPVSGVMGTSSVGGATFKPQGFGNFTAEQFAMGQADMAFPFNPIVGQDVNVFHIEITPGIPVANGDQLVLTFPDGTTVTNAAMDTLSPFASDLNQAGGGTITGAVASADNTSKKVTIGLTVSGGTPGASDKIFLDLRKITNPPIPSNPSLGGSTLGIKISRGGTILANKTSMPFFIMAGGTNIISVNVVAGSATGSPTAGANGTVYLHGGGPGGPMDKTVTLTNGAISAVDGSSTTSIQFGNLPDGCYFLGTDPIVTLGSNDYFGQSMPEPICVNSGAISVRYILLTPAAGSGAVTTTIKLAGIADFGGVNIDIFAGGPGRYVVKTLTSVGVPAVGGYIVKLPANGDWFIGIGPSMPKGASMSMPTALPGVPPPPINVTVSGLGGDSPSLSRPSFGTLPTSVSFNDSTDTITFTFAAADKTISGTVKDGSNNGLSNVNVFMHSKGFGAPVSAATNASGTFSLAVSDYGSYEIGAFKDGMPPSFKQIEIRTDGSDAGTDPDIYYDGKQITDANPLVITLKKAAYSISGKVLDSNNNAIKYAPVFAIDSNGNMMPGQSGSEGDYTVFVGAGTWTVRAELPPSNTDVCGTFSKVVTVTNESKSQQNITPSVSTCVTLSGTVSVGGAVMANTPLFIEEWDNTNSRPVPGGAKKGTATDSNGNYSVKLAGSTIYRVGTWSSDYGELSAVKSVAGSNTTQNISVSATSTVTFNFTGGTSAMKAFIELKNASNQMKRIGKQFDNLSSAASIAVESGETFNYFVDVFGFGKFSGTVTSGGTVTVNVSTSGFVTVTGTVYTGSVSTTYLTGALVTFTNTSTGIVQSATTDSNGQYSVKVKAGSYSVSSAGHSYLPGQTAQTASFTTSTTAYDFGGESPDQMALMTANRTIEGTLSGSGGSAMSEGYVWATNASGTVISAPVDSDGTYSLSVTPGVWTVKAAGPQSAETTKSGTVTVAGSSSTGNDFTLTADTTRVPTSTNGVVAADSGGSVNDSANTGIKITAGPGVLETGSSNITLTLEKNFTAPDSEDFQALGNTTFSISAKSTSAITDLTGNAEIQFDYASVLSQLPAGVSENDLKLMYYSTKQGEYVPLEGGFTVDTVNNTISGQTDHFTDFVIAYAPSVTSPAPAAPPSGGTSSSAAAVVVTTPTVSTSTTAATSTPAASTSTTPSVAPNETAVTQPALAPAIATISNPASAVAISDIVAASYQPGATLKFNYQYANSGVKSLKIKVKRELVNSKGKIVSTASAIKSLKPGAVFKSSVKEAVNKKLPAGVYTMRIKIYNAATGKLLEQNSFKIVIEKLKKKVFTLGQQANGAADIHFDEDSLAKVKSGVALPANLKAKYVYTNNSGAAHKVKMTRQLLGANGKVLDTKTGKWVMAVGEKDGASFTQPVAGNLAVGNYIIRVAAYDWSTKELLAENWLWFAVELK